MFATMHTTAGDIRIELFPNQAPHTVKNFVGLAEGSKEWTDPKTGERRPSRSTTASPSTA